MIHLEKAMVPLENAPTDNWSFRAMTEGEGGEGGYTPESNKHTR